MKYLELVKGKFTAEHEVRAKQADPYVAYSIEDDKLMFNLIPEENQTGYQIVDLGLPSGTLWADRNIGSTSPEDKGLYFAWGDVTGYKDEHNFSWENYKYSNEDGSQMLKYNSTDNLTVLELEDDPAYMNIGDEWRTMHQSEFVELCTYTNKIFEDLDGNKYWYEYNSDTKPEGVLDWKVIDENCVKGIYFVSTINNNSIFMPTCSDNTNVIFWTNSNDGWQDSALYVCVLNTGDVYSVAYSERYQGTQIRGIVR